MRIPAERIVVVKLGAIGDVVNSLPFVERLRAGAPDARIHWVVAPLSRPLLEDHPALDGLLVFHADRPRTWPGFLRALRGLRADLAIDLQRLIKSGLITRLSGAPVRLGFDRARCKERSHLFTNRRIPPNDAPGVTVAQYLEFADFLELPPRAPTWRLPHDPPPAAERALSGAGPDVCVHVGASWESKLWLPERWARVCDLLVEELDARVHLTGGPGDRPIADAVLAAAHVPVDDRVGRLSLRQTAGLLARSDLYVGPDTGPLHMAVALGKRVVGLYGAPDPRRTAPFGQEDTGVVYLAPPCAPCRKRVCRVPGHPCMTGITPELVLEHVRASLAAAR